MCLVGIIGGWGKQVSQYYFSELGLRHGSLYMNGKMLDLEGPTFNAFQVSEGVCGNMVLVEYACLKMWGISIWYLFFSFFIILTHPLSPPTFIISFSSLAWNSMLLDS